PTGDVRRGLRVVRNRIMRSPGGEDLEDSGVCGLFLTQMADVFIVSNTVIGDCAGPLGIQSSNGAPLELLTTGALADNLVLPTRRQNFALNRCEAGTVGPDLAFRPDRLTGLGVIGNAAQRSDAARLGFGGLDLSTTGRDSWTRLLPEPLPFSPVID